MILGVIIVVLGSFFVNGYLANKKNRSALWMIWGFIFPLVSTIILASLSQNQKNLRERKEGNLFGKMFLFWIVFFNPIMLAVEQSASTHPIMSTIGIVIFGILTVKDVIVFIKTKKRTYLNAVFLLPCIFYSLWFFAKKEDIINLNQITQINIVSTLAAYKNTHGKYPDTLEDLIPDYIESINDWPKVYCHLEPGKMSYEKIPKENDEFKLFGRCGYKFFEYDSISKQWKTKVHEP